MPILHLEPLIDFYDRRVQASVGHASAINAVMGEDMAIALIKDYFFRRGQSASLIDKRCTQGTQKGKRLDAWIEIMNEDGTYQYQTEIKNWSAHAIGGRASPSNPSVEAMIKYRINRWCNVFNIERKALKEEASNKVLTPMRPNSSEWKVRPLIIFWDAMHPTGQAIEFFKIETSSDHFSHLWVFSMSTYVRNLLADNIKCLTVELHDTDKRLEWFGRFFGRVGER